MKTVLFLLAILGLSQGASIAQPRDLSDDLQDFIDLIPTDQILAILMESLSDPEVIQVYAYVFSSGFHTLVTDIENIDEYKEVRDYLTAAGLPVDRWVAVFKEFIGHPDATLLRTSVHRGVNDVILAIIAVLPLDEIKALYYDKLANVPEFAELVANLHSDEFLGFVAAIKENSEVQRLGAELRALGVDLDTFFYLIKAFFGFN